MGTFKREPSLEALPVAAGYLSHRRVYHAPYSYHQRYRTLILLCPSQGDESLLTLAVSLGFYEATVAITHVAPSAIQEEEGVSVRCGESDVCVNITSMRMKTTNRAFIAFAYEPFVPVAHP